MGSGPGQLLMSKLDGQPHFVRGVSPLEQIDTRVVNFSGVAEMGGRFDEAKGPISESKPQFQDSCHLPR